jgi:multiple sugar transport system substrate-binding protein
MFRKGEKEMKKSILFTLLVAVLLLAACAPAAAPTAAVTEPTLAQPPAAAPTKAASAAEPPVAVPTEELAAQPVAAQEITFMAWGDPSELDVWNQIVADFEKANPGIKVNVEVSDWDSYWTKLKTLLAAKTPPDVFAMDAPLYLDYQSRGVLQNLQPYIDKSPDMLKDVYPQTLAAYNLPDGYYGLPRDFQTVVLFYNKDMFDAAKVPYPTDQWTMNDLREAAKKLTLEKNKDGKKQYGFAADVWDMELFWSEAIWGYGGDVISPDHTKTLIGEPKAREAWQFIDDMMHKDGSMPDPNVSGEYGGDPFLAGAAAMTTIGHWAIPGYAQSGFKWDVVPMPAGPAGRATSVNSAGFVVAKDSKNPDAAFKFIQYVLSPEGQTSLTQLGLAIPVLKTVAESPTFLNQKMVDINQKAFLDSVAFARMKPVFKGYEEWAAAVGDGMAPIWTGEAELNPTLDTVVKSADEVLANNK